MCKTDEFCDSARSDEIFASPSPSILLAGDNVRLTDLVSRTLIDEGFAIQLAAGYHHVDSLWHQHRHPVILLDVSNARAVEAAVAAALAVKRFDPGQFVGYLADPILRTSGLAGDAIFPRNLRQLPEALRKHFDRPPEED
jgi:hypothetical protein